MPEMVTIPVWKVVVENSFDHLFDARLIDVFFVPSPRRPDRFPHHTNVRIAWRTWEEQCRHGPVNGSYVVAAADRIRHYFTKTAAVDAAATLSGRRVISFTSNLFIYLFIYYKKRTKCTQNTQSERDQTHHWIESNSQPETICRKILLMSLLVMLIYQWKKTNIRHARE